MFIVSDSEDVRAISSDDDENLPPIHFASPSGPSVARPPTSPYQTPCTPATGIMFWGSPTMENIKARTTASKKHIRPLGVSNLYDSPSGKLIVIVFNIASNVPINVIYEILLLEERVLDHRIIIISMLKNIYKRNWVCDMNLCLYCVPGAVLSMSTPKGKPTRPPPSLTTPSASKNFSRFKMTMVDELYSQFNRTVFDNKVQRERERERYKSKFFANKQLPVDMKIIWNKKLRTTAGYCCYLGALGDRDARIELSTKVVDSYGRYDRTIILVRNMKILQMTLNFSPSQIVSETRWCMRCAMQPLGL